MTPDTNPTSPAAQSGTVIEAWDSAFWHASGLSLEWQGARLLILGSESAQRQTAMHWQACFPNARRVVLRSPFRPIEGGDEPFDVAIDASGRLRADAVLMFQRVFPHLSESGVYVFSYQAAQGLLSAIDVERAEMMAQVRSVEFAHGLCLVHKGSPSLVRLPLMQAIRSDSEQETFRLAAEVVRLRGELERETEALRRAATAHAHIVDEFHASTSWRVTMPLRWVGAQVLRARGAIRSFNALRKGQQGTFGALRQGVRTLRRVGFNGLAPAVTEGKKRPEDYEEWVRRYDTLDHDKRMQLLKLVSAMPHQPLISILMPVYNPGVEWLQRAIVSVQAQIYPRWELCVADDASSDPAGREVLARLASEDSRIKIVHRAQNGHISAASNSALALVTGEWTALMDQDDLIPVHALVWVAHAINAHPDVQLIYSDEDKIDDNDRRFDAYFKPDWNIDLFLSQNMFSHLGVYRTQLLRDVGGFREGFEGSQDYDLVLRCIERIRHDQIHHIPKVLYHWRVHPQSTASSTTAKPYAHLAGEKALNEHFARSGVRGHVKYVGNGYRAFYDLPSPAPLVSLIIPTRNAMKLVRQCIDSILERTTYRNYEIVLVDNGSDEPASLDYFNSLKLNPRIRVIRDSREFNYSALNNAAVEQARGEYIGLINNDIEVITPEWLSEMVAIASQPGVGAVGARLWYPDDTLQHGGVILGIGGVAGHAHKRLPKERHGYFERAALMQSFSAVTAACLIVRKKHYLDVGGLNDVDLTVAFNDVDFCIKLRECGLRNIWTPYAELLHHESATRGGDTNPEKQKRFESEARYMLNRWGDLLGRDPAYNPNLTLAHEDFSLAWPPST